MTRRERCAHSIAVAALLVIPAAWVDQTGMPPAAVAHANASDQAIPSTERVFVLAELFTSEGCSSCPPADDVLTKVVGTQPVQGVDVIGVGEHVDYWDNLGWKDPFSSASFSSRQSQYAARVFHTNSIYTPQIVVDGRTQAIGSDEGAVRRLIVDARERPKANLQTTVGWVSPTALTIEVSAHFTAQTAPGEPADIMVAITEDGLVTNVRSGENGGRALRHSAVARTMLTLGEVPSGRPSVSGSKTVAWSPQWIVKNARVVALVQERQSRRIVAVGATPIPPSGTSLAGVQK